MATKRKFEEALESPAKRKNYQTFSLEYKLKIIKQAQESGNKRKTARDNNVNESLLRNWMKNEAQIKKTLTLNTQNPLRIKGGGRKVKNSCSLASINKVLVP